MTPPSLPSQSGTKVLDSLWPQLTVFLLIGIELCWVTPWFRTVIEISYSAAPWLQASILGVFMLAGYSFGLLFDRLRLMRSFSEGALVLLYLFFLLIGGQILLNYSLGEMGNSLFRLQPGAVLLVITTVWLWWRGVVLAQDTVRPLVVWRRFILWLFLLVAHAFIVTRMEAELLNRAPGLWLFTTFVFISLLAMVLGRVSFVGLTHGVKKNPFDRRWFWSTVTIIGFTVAISMTLGVLLTGQYRLMLDQLAEGVKFGALAIFYVLTLPFLLLSYLLGPLLPWLRQFLPSPAANQPAAPNPYPGAADGPPLQPPAQIVQITPTMQLVLFWGLVLILLIGFLWTRRGAGKPGREGMEDSESLLGQGDALKLLRKFLQEGISNLAHIGQRFQEGQRRLAAARIRRIYAQLMELSAELHQPRDPAQTPLEFLPVLGELFPAQMTGLERITEAYLRVRYGQLPESQAEVNRIEQDWTAIAAEGRRLKRARLSELKTANVDEVRGVKM